MKRTCPNFIDFDRYQRRLIIAIFTNAVLWCIDFGSLISLIYGRDARKRVFEVLDQVRHKLVCTVTEEG